MPAPAGPQCPDCGYSIFGVRDMRCPECGRTLVHADFNFDLEDSRARQKKLRRDGQIGLTAGFIMLLIPLGLAGLLAYAFLQYNVLPRGVFILFIFFAIWIWRVLAWMGDQALPAKKKRR